MKCYCKFGEDFRCVIVVQDMINVLLVVCKNGVVDFISSWLLDIVDGSFDDVRCLLNILDLLFEICSVEWLLKMFKFLFIDCGIKDLSVIVIMFFVFQVVWLNVLFLVVKCFLEL